MRTIQIATLDNGPSRFKYFIASAGSISILLAVAMVVSIVFYEPALAGDDLSDAVLIAPAPPKAEPEPQPQVQPQPATPQQQTQASSPQLQPVAQVAQNQAPTAIDPSVPISTTIPTQPNGFLPTTEPGTASNNQGPPRGGNGNGDGEGISVSNQTSVVATEPEPDPPKPKPVDPPAKPKVVSMGPVNGKATYLPTPPYPPHAKLVRAAGPVMVEVLFDEDGNVLSAKAKSGHPLLRSAAETAAKQAKFTPTTLGGTKVKVNGTITYNFVL